MSIAVVTRADDAVREWTELTHPLFKKYAEKCGADFIVLSEPAPFLTSDHQPHYRILRIYDLLEKYDRILHLDTDMLINEDCPNLFEVVPENMIGIVFEDVGSRQADRRMKMAEMQFHWGDVGWRTGYTNAGTFVLSKEHRDVFLPHDDQYWIGWGSADLQMSYNIHKFNLKVHELSYKWNHMTMFSHDWNGNADRFKSYIIHYAGKGIFDENQASNKLEQAKLDYEVIYGKK